MKEKSEKITELQAKRQVTKDLFISVLALISVGIGLYDLKNTRQSSHFTWYDILDLIIVGIFIVDFVWSAIGSGNWKNYTRRHWYEIPSLIPITGNMVVGAQAIPLLRSLRLVRLVRVVRLLRVVGSAVRLKRFWTTFFRIARRAHIDVLALFAFLVILAGAGIAWVIESRANADFRDIGDSLWWAVNMFTNVAYVEFHPVTFGGRIVAGLLEFTGIAFIGLFTASLAGALLTDKHPETEEKMQPLE
ncbi:MAG TPA: ion transporter [Saprospiraceae bacterium]|nr:ion transporter [Saprospiraceae bacterium]